MAASQSDRSPSSRRAWIEILRWTTLPDYQAVALLAEGVDRNTHESALRWADVVALLAEGVDRNFYITQITNADWTVALLAEGVDRNIQEFGRSYL